MSTSTTAKKRVEDFMDYDFDNRCNLPENCVGDYPRLGEFTVYAEIPLKV